MAAKRKTPSRRKIRLGVVGCQRGRSFMAAAEHVGMELVAICDNWDVPLKGAAQQFPEAETVVRGDKEHDDFYYTNSIHLRADAPVDMLTRIIKQSKFHTMIESGAIIHAFVGEERPPWDSIMALVKKTFEKTRAAQLTISPEFTICNTCKKVARKLVEECPYCESSDVYGITRIVGYFSRINNWNRSKLGELRDRHRGDYSVAGLTRSGTGAATDSETRAAEV